jgi:multidrug efflux pump subunit AcrA (membrane-fusion protein)
MASPSPQFRLRPDLERSEQRHQGASVLVVKDPIARRYFRFTEGQAALLALMEEPIDATSLALAVSEKFGQTISPESINAFFKSLEQKLLLDTPQVRETLEAMGGQQRKERNLLYWKLAAIDPERVFAWLLPRTRWAFTPAFHVIGILTILCGFEIFYSNWHELSASAPRLFSGYGLLLIFPVIFMVVTIHEFSHGLTCRHFGGKVHEVGFMLIYFQPAFYCDVSDSWLFPSRRNRLWVTLAGGYVQFIVWGMCAIVWRITDPDTLISHAALTVLLYSGLQSLINFNPLIKLDGYYMLSDYLEIPNLRAKAAKTVWNWVAGKPQAQTGENSRGLRAQFIYGVAAIVFSTSLLFYVYSSLFRWSTSHYHFAGLIGFAMFSTYTLRKTAAESISGVRALATRAAVKKFRNLGIAGTLALIAILGHWELRIPAEFRVVARDERSVRAQTDGIVVAIFVEEGREVKKGDKIAQMRDFEKQQKITDLDGLIAERRSSLALAMAGSRPEEIEKGLRLVKTKETELENAKPNPEALKQLDEELARKKLELERADRDLRREELLFRDGLRAREQLEKAQTDVNVRKSDVAETAAAKSTLLEASKRQVALKESELAEARSALDLLMAGSRKEEIQRLNNEIERLVRQRRLYDEELAKTDLVATIDGVISTRSLNQLLHKRLEAGDEFCKIVDIRRIYAEMLVPEKELADIGSGNPVRMKVRGFPNEEITGRVDFIAPVAERVENQRMFMVRSEISNDKLLLRPEMTGVAKIEAGERRIIDLITRRLRLWIRTELWDLSPLP